MSVTNWLHSVGQTVGEVILQKPMIASVAPASGVMAAITILAEVLSPLVALGVGITAIYASYWVAKVHKAQHDKIINEKQEIE